MIILEPAKKCLRSISPSLYMQAKRLYRATTHIKRRDARTDHEVADRLRVRLEHEAKLVKEYLNNDWTVRHGPFAGMRYALLTSGSLLSPKIIGSYESPIHQWITDAIAHNYEKILNIGCGEGYYAVGFSLKSKATHVYAYDIDAQARENVLTIARLNGATDNLHIRGQCTVDELQREVTGRTLILCDTDGGEFDLFRPDLVPGLSQADLIIETHDYCCPGVTETLAGRFLPSHRVEITYHCAKTAKTFPVLATIPIEEHAFLLEEGRPRSQRWMRVLANLPEAIEPEPDQWWLPPGEIDPPVPTAPPIKGDPLLRCPIVWTRRQMSSGHVEPPIRQNCQLIENL
jgi:hypothetical protein